MDDLHHLLTLIRARHPAVHIVTPEEPDAIDLVTRAASQCGAHLWRWDAVDGLTSPLDTRAGPVANTEHPAAAMEWLVINDLASIILLIDASKYLEDPKTLRTLRRLLAHANSSGSCVILLDHQSALPDAVAAWATPFELPLPDDEAIDRLVRETLRELHVQLDIDVKIRPSDYNLILKNLRGLSRRQCAQIIRDVVADDRRFDADDLNRVLAAKRRMVGNRGVLEYVESPASLDQIGGMRKLKDYLAEREKAFDPKAAAFGISPPRGILLLGVQGAGKSLCAKAIATAWKRPLLRLDPGTLYDRYIGESERRLREAFQQAEAMAPIVLWIDEIEKGFASAGESSNDGGLSRRMFGSLLTWMQEHRSPVFLVATANDVQSLPPELLRKGRFDEIFFVDLPGDEAREAIFRTHLRRRRQDPDEFNLPALLVTSTGYSGAEIEQAIVSGLHAAYNAGEQLTTDHITEALQGSPPLSVIMAERIDGLRRWAASRCVPAD